MLQKHECSRSIKDHQNLPAKDSYLLPLEEKQSAYNSSSTFLSKRRLGDRETRQIHLSANEFAGIQYASAISSLTGSRKAMQLTKIFDPSPSAENYEAHLDRERLGYTHTCKNTKCRNRRKQTERLIKTQ